MRTTRVVAAAAGLLLVATGLWAFTAPRSFYEVVATYPPFNQHLLHDIGAFNLGLGAALLLALAWADGLLVALGGVGVGAAAHALAHWLDRELGGSPADPWYLTAFAVLLLAAAARRWKEIRR
jgi:uncharacterized protein YjeT (DUF2065 family)